MNKMMKIIFKQLLEITVDMTVKIVYYVHKGKFAQLGFLAKQTKYP